MSLVASYNPLYPQNCSAQSRYVIADSHLDNSAAHSGVYKGVIVFEMPGKTFLQSIDVNHTSGKYRECARTKETGTRSSRSSSRSGGVHKPGKGSGSLSASVKKHLKGCGDDGEDPRKNKPVELGRSHYAEFTPIYGRVLLKLHRIQTLRNARESYFDMGQPERLERLAYFRIELGSLEKAVASARDDIEKLNEHERAVIESSPVYKEVEDLLGLDD